MLKTNAQETCSADTEIPSWAENVDRTNLLRYWLSFYFMDSYPGLLSTCHLEYPKGKFYTRAVSRHPVLPISKPPTLGCSLA